MSAKILFLFQIVNSVNSHRRKHVKSVQFSIPFECNQRLCHRQFYWGALVYWATLVTRHWDYAERVFNK